MTLFWNGLVVVESSKGETMAIINEQVTHANFKQKNKLFDGSTKRILMIREGRNTQWNLMF